MEDDILLPDDFQETATPSAEIETTEKVEDTKPTETVTESPKVKLKYNHEEKEYSLDDVVPLAQKGLNYDKLQEKFNQIQNDPRLSKYDRLQQASELLGYQSDDELLDALYDNYYSSTAEKQGLTPEQVRKEHELKQKETAIQQKEQSLTQKEKDNQMYAKFAENFPDVKAEMISQDTWSKVNAGMDLTTAYIMQQNSELQAKVKTMEQNAATAQKAPVGGVSVHGHVEPAQEDDFMSGFNEI